MHDVDFYELKLDGGAHFEDMRQRRSQKMLRIYIRRLDRVSALRMIEIDCTRRDAIKIRPRIDREQRQAVFIGRPQDLPSPGIAANTDAVRCLDEDAAACADTSNDILIDRHVAAVVALRISGVDMDHGRAFIET